MLFTEDVAANERNPFGYFQSKNFEMQRSVKKQLLQFVMGYAMVFYTSFRRTSINPLIHNFPKWPYIL